MSLRRDRLVQGTSPLNFARRTCRPIESFTWALSRVPRGEGGMKVTVSGGYCMNRLYLSSSSFLCAVHKKE